MNANTLKNFFNHSSMNGMASKEAVLPADREKFIIKTERWRLIVALFVTNALTWLCLQPSATETVQTIPHYSLPENYLSLSLPIESFTIQAGELPQSVSLFSKGKLLSQNAFLHSGELIAPVPLSFDQTSNAKWMRVDIPKDAALNVLGSRHDRIEAYPENIYPNNKNQEKEYEIHF
jgi:hypothetical protein